MKHKAFIGPTAMIFCGYWVTIHVIRPILWILILILFVWCEDIMNT